MNFERIDRQVGRLFILAGIINIAGTLLFSKGLSNQLLFDIYPEVFSVSSVLVIWLWGAAYLSVAGNWQKLTWLNLVFALEKLFFFITWLVLQARPDFDSVALFDTDILTGMFYATYGPNDLFFAIVFFYAFYRAWITGAKDSESSR